MKKLRIVGGIWRGRTIEAPKSSTLTRPSTDRTREMIASMVLSSFELDLSAVSVLDAFAGSGALGLEMLSRGASSCLFVDIDRMAAALVRRNIAALGAKAQAQVRCADISRLCATKNLTGAPFGLVLLDPPYAMAAAHVCELIELLWTQGFLTRRARVVYERARDATGLFDCGAYLLRSKTCGGTSVDLLQISDATGKGDSFAQRSQI